MKQSLSLSTSQQLTLTPQLKQSLKLLQLSALDLEQEIQLQLDTNPLLERDESNSEDNFSELNDTDQTIASTTNDAPQPINEASDPSYEMDRTDYLDAEQDLSGNWEQAFESNRLNSNQLAGSNSSSNTNSEISQYVSKQESLFEHLHWQLQMSFLSDKDKNIAEAILYCIDEDGYLVSKKEDIESLFSDDPDIETEEINAVLSFIKTLDPIGVGCRNLSERLLLLLTQLPADTPNLEHAKVIVEQHIDLLANRDIAKLKKATHLDDQALSSTLTLITELKPRIANQFKTEYSDYVAADVVVKKINDEWVVNLNSTHQSKLRINPIYANMLRSSIDEQETEYIQQNLQQAKMFIKGLMSRYDTLLLVSQAIVERQQSFFEYGDEQMKPMVLQDIAQELGLHESTISRATSGKYLLSPRGLFELKYFFSSAISSTSGVNSSSVAIRSLIKKMVESESKQKPLSDNKIAQQLEQQGHIVARRTVAKYRESMQIAPSSQRKSLT